MPASSTPASGDRREGGAPGVLVLGAHRSGTGTVTGLLASAAGLRLGDVLSTSDRSSPDTVGAWESAGVVRAHNRILDDLDRDWTCPPGWFDPETVSTAGLAEHLATLRSRAGPWGVKDPRLLFLLPAWTGLVDRVRIVGVVRDHEEVVRSVLEHDGIDAAVADGIVRAHVHRLRVLQEEFGFPVVDFSASSDEIRETTRDVAGALGLAWDDRAARAFLDQSRATDRAQGALVNPDVDHLRRHARPDSDVPVVRSESLAAFLATRPDDTTELDRHSGPRAAARRRHLWSLVPHDLGDVREFTRTVRHASSVDPAPDRARVVEGRDLLAVYDELRGSPTGADAIVLADVASWIDPADLVAAFELLHDLLADHGMVVVGRSTADREVAEAVGRRAPTIDEIVAAAREAHFAVLATSERPNLSVVRLVVRPTTERLLRKLLDDDGTERGLWPSGRRGRGSRAARRGPGKDDRPWPPAGDHEYWQDRHETLRNRKVVRLALAVADRAEPVLSLVPGVEPVDRPDPDQPSGRDWRARYERLRDRRAVRAAVAVADFAEPVVRRVRGRGRHG